MGCGFPPPEEEAGNDSEYLPASSSVGALRAVARPLNFFFQIFRNHIFWRMLLKKIVSVYVVFDFDTTKLFAAAAFVFFSLLALLALFLETTSVSFSSSPLCSASSSEITGSFSTGVIVDAMLAVLLLVLLLVELLVLLLVVFAFLLPCRWRHC